MTPVDQMSLRAAMDVASKNVGYAIEMMIVVMALMKKIAHQQRARRKNLRVRKIIASAISGGAMESRIVLMEAMNG